MVLPQARAGGPIPISAPTKRPRRIDPGRGAFRNRGLVSWEIQLPPPKRPASAVPVLLVSRAARASRPAAAAVVSAILDFRIIDSWRGGDRASRRTPGRRCSSQQTMVGVAVAMARRGYASLPDQSLPGRMDQESQSHQSPVGLPVPRADMQNAPRSSRRVLARRDLGAGRWSLRFCGGEVSLPWADEGPLESQCRTSPDWWPMRGSISAPESSQQSAHP